jgi:RNA polymerase sigma-70 factor (ECF subfamily)
MDYGVALQANILAAPSTKARPSVRPEPPLIAVTMGNLLEDSRGFWLLTYEHQAAMAALGLKARAGRGMTDTLTDQVLVDRAKRGDEIAFSELVTRHYRRALRVAYGLLHNNDDAQDVTQDAFARVHTRLASFEGTSAFYTWLYRIVVNLSIDAIRRRRRERRVDLEDEEMRDTMRSGEDLWPRYDDTHPGESAERQELQHQLRRAFKDLPEIHQAVILLRELEGMSYEEIAATLKIKKGTVMSRLFHARRSMQVSFAKAAQVEDCTGSEGKR